MMKESKNWLNAYNVASTWLGSQCGPGVAAGTMLMSYFLMPGGWMSIWTPVLSMAILGILYYIGLEVARLYNVHNYSSFAKVFWGKYGFIAGYAQDILTIYGNVIALSAIFGGANALCRQMLGVPPLVGSLLVAVVSIILVVYGEEIVRKASGIMATVILLLIIVFCGMALIKGWGNLAENVRTRWVPETYNTGKLVTQFLLYTNIQLGFVTVCASVSEPLTRKKDSARAAFLGFVMNAAMLLIISLAMLAYTPGVIGEAIPVFTILNDNFPGVVVWIYSILYFLALVSTTCTMMFNISKRFKPLIMKKIKSERTAVAVPSTILALVGIGISSFGILWIFNTLYPVVGYLRYPILTIPLIVIAPVMIRKARRKQAAEQAEETKA